MVILLHKDSDAPKMPFKLPAYADDRAPLCLALNKLLTPKSTE